MLSIINYHILYDESLPADIAREELIYAVDKHTFRQHIEYMDNNCYREMSLEYYTGSRLNPPDNRDLTKNAVIITFDDGHVSIYTHTMPILLEYGFPAVFFITVENIGMPNYVNWNQLREMADNGMSIQSHTMTHSFLSDLSPEKIRWELQESKTILEQKLGYAVDCLSLPGGRYSFTVRKIAMEVGYRAVCTSIIGYNDANTDLYSLRRWTIRRNMKFSTFNAIVRGNRSALAYYKTRYFLLSGLKKMIGNRIYASIHRNWTGR